jgi:hypothetical protein
MCVLFIWPQAPGSDRLKKYESWVAIKLPDVHIIPKVLLLSMGLFLLLYFTKWQVIVNCDSWPSWLLIQWYHKNYIFFTFYCSDIWCAVESLFLIVCLVFGILEFRRNPNVWHGEPCVWNISQMELLYFWFQKLKWVLLLQQFVVVFQDIQPVPKLENLSKNTCDMLCGAKEMSMMKLLYRFGSSKWVLLNALTQIACGVGCDVSMFGIWDISLLLLIYIYICDWAACIAGYSMDIWLSKG